MAVVLGIVGLDMSLLLGLCRWLVGSLGSPVITIRNLERVDGEVGVVTITTLLGLHRNIDITQNNGVSVQRRIL